MSRRAASDDDARGVELRAFLSGCRKRLRPELCGLVTARSRRAPGLRQEDVAALTGVSPRWYEVFERGNSGRRFSAAFVRRVAVALALDDADRAVLFRLALPEVAEAVDYFEQEARSAS